MSIALTGAELPEYDSWAYFYLRSVNSREPGLCSGLFAGNRALGEIRVPFFDETRFQLKLGRRTS